MGKSTFKNFFDEFCDSKIVLHYIDVGAMGGISLYWKQLLNHCHVIAFEPDEREFIKLKSDAHITYLPYALYHSSQDLRFYISRDQGKSSIYPPNMALLKDFPDDQRYETIQEIEFSREKVKSLDEALATAGIKEVDFIKIDTQGSELDILKGAKANLDLLCGVELEVEFAPLYKGQALFRDVDAFMDEKGFQLMNLRRSWWKRKKYTGYIGSGQLVFGDALYFRKIDSLLNALKQKDQAVRTAKIIKAATISMVYRLPDYAIDLLDQANAKGWLEVSQFQQLSGLIRKEASSWGMPGLWGRSLLAKIFNRCAEMVRPASHLGFSDADRFIGNTRNL